MSDKQPTPISLDQIARMDWVDFSPEAKKNRVLLGVMFKYAEPLRFELADLIQSQSEVLDEKTLFTLKAFYHILNQWVLEIPKLQIENLERDSNG